MSPDDVLSQIKEHFHILSLGEKSLDFGKILSTETSLKVLESVYNCDPAVGMSAAEISEAMGVGRTTVIYHLGRMHESGLININPVLVGDESWGSFWELYRTGNADVNREQFNKIHNAKMNGVKLFVPTKKGFLVLPSTDPEKSDSLAKEALASITAPVVERDYNKMKKTTSVLGSIGLLLIALSFLFQPPNFLMKDDAVFFSPGIEVREMAQTEVKVDEITPPAPAAETMETTAKLATQPQQDGPMSGASDLATEEGEVGEEGKVELLGEAPPEDVGERLAVTTRGEEAQIMAAAQSYNFASKVMLYAGMIFLGSFIGFLSYSYIRRRRS